MKRIALFIITLFVCVVCYGATFNQYWYVEDNAPIQTSCTTGGDIILPTPPTKYGYDFIGWEKLPIQRIEYLESTGTQWIDTGVRFSNINQYRIVIKYEYINVNRGQSIAGAQPSYCFIPYTSDFGLVSIYHSSLTGALGTKIFSNTIYTLDMKQNGNIFTLNINGVTKTAEVNASSSGYPYFLFATSNGTRAIELASAKIYLAQIYENNTLVRDFIPVLAPSGIPCLYDKVEGKFYYNAGTGDFIAGPVLTE